MVTWMCDQEGCGLQVNAMGSILGLRAIGWYVGWLTDDGDPSVYCPAHRPDCVPCREASEYAKPCSMCAAESAANEIQAKFIKDFDD